MSSVIPVVIDPRSNFICFLSGEIFILKSLSTTIYEKHTIYWFSTSYCTKILVASLVYIQHVHMLKVSATIFSLARTLVVVFKFQSLWSTHLGPEICVCICNSWNMAELKVQTHNKAVRLLQHIETALMLKYNFSAFYSSQARIHQLSKHRHRVAVEKTN